MDEETKKRIEKLESDLEIMTDCYHSAIRLNIGFLDTIKQLKQEKEKKS